VILFLLFSIGALFYGLFHLVTAKQSSVKTYQSLKYRVIFAICCIIFMALYFLFEKA